MQELVEIGGSASSNRSAINKPSYSTGPTSAAGLLAPVSASADAFTRIIHPVNGNFDVVITQSARDDTPEFANLLKGNPVYTVYLQVGDKKEWVLEYCLPAQENSRNSINQLYVENVEPLSPPYPITTVIPSSLTFSEQPSSIILHGRLTVTGDFRNIEDCSLGNPTRPQLAPYIEQWRFRPALKNRTPTEVEVLLVIPARTG